jgi:hypothetical protein
MEDHQVVLSRMTTQLSTWKEAGDRRAIFLECYAMMTRNILAAIQHGEFHDAAWVGNLMAHFAGYYFVALQAYEQHPGRSPAVWRLTFDRARQGKLHAVQNLLLGVNAHINYDLILALGDQLQPDWHALDEAGRRERYDDHGHVNQVIARTIDAVQDTVLEPAEPSMDLIDRLLGPLDEWMISRLIDGWRERVWRQAVLRVESASPAAREVQRLEFERDCLKRADRILLDDPDVELRG